jgi:H+/Cl- antiporter ClcA
MRTQAALGRPGVQVARSIGVGALVGTLAGTAAAVFLVVLDAVTRLRLENPDLLFLLPFAGLLIGWAYHRFGGAAGYGSSLVIGALHETRTDDPVDRAAARIPLRAAPMVLIGTWLTHLFGGSAGREGTAVQMAAALADGVFRLLRIAPAERPLVIAAGVSGGFAAVFGTPAAGVVFSLEVARRGSVCYSAVGAAVAAAVVGDAVARAWGVTHSPYPASGVQPLNLVLVAKTVAAGAGFGGAAVLFILLTTTIRRIFARWVPVVPLRPFIGGLLIIGLAVIVGSREYLGLSLPLIARSLEPEGAGPNAWAFALKLVFTAVTLGSGFVGGEVTPLFAIGAALGHTLGHLLGLDPAFTAALGFAAVFAGASKTPLACTVMGVELFGGGSVLYLLVACFTAYAVSGRRSIYSTQR